MVPMLSQELVPGGDFGGPRWARNLPTASALGEAPWRDDSQDPEQDGSREAQGAVQGMGGGKSVLRE